jgi:ElaB/YqjD/DUF883 family membrane-anchored ribosome-binding protein
METRDKVRQSLEARVDELERQIDQMVAKAGHASTDTANRLRSRLRTLRERLAAIRARLRAKEDADVKAENAALAEVGHLIDDTYEEVQSWPK